MNDLLAFAVDAHGGLDRWNNFSMVSAGLSIAGAIWDVKQVPGILVDKVFEADIRKQYLTVTPFGGVDSRLVYSPERVFIEGPGGAVIDARDDPEAAYADQTVESPWDKFHTGLARGGETWRSLRVIVPQSHHQPQDPDYALWPDGMMRRHDYTVDILGGAQGANYSSDYRDFQGIKISTKRRIYAHDEEMQKIPDPPLVSIDFRTLTFS
jgi:hypothetical protein